MTDSDSPTSASGRERSPSFPFISLPLSIKRLDSVEKKFGRHAMPNSKAGIAWGLQPESSQAQQTLAALKAYGLVLYQGSSTDRRSVISDFGRIFLRAQQESILRAAAREAVLKPRIFGELFGEWGATRPPDAVCLDDLVLKRKFTEAAAARLLRVYDKNVEFAQLAELDRPDAGPFPEDTDTSEFAAPDELGSSAGAPPSHPVGLSGQTHMNAVYTSTAEAFTEVFSSDSGQVALTWPKALSAPEAEEVEAWLNLIIKKVKRRTQASPTE